MTTASPIYSFAEDASRAESVAWAKFSAAKNSPEFLFALLKAAITRMLELDNALDEARGSNRRS